MAFKMRGFSGFKQEAPRKKSLNPTGPRDKEGYFETLEGDGTNTPASTKTKPTTRKTSDDKDFPTGDTKVVKTTHTKHTKDGKKHSKIRGLAPDTTTETSTIGQKGKQKGDTTVHESEGGLGGARTYKKSGKEESYFGEETEAREFDPTRRDFKY